MNTHMNTALNTSIALLKREAWEHRSFWLVPTIMAGVILLAFLWAMGYVVPSTIGYDGWVMGMADEHTEELARIGSLFIPGLALPFFIMVEIVTLFYLLDSLYAERRDRSILFWKSLPVSDTATVLSKWGAMVLVFPAIVFAVIVALSLALMLLIGVFVLFGGGNPWTLAWQHYGLFNGLGSSLAFFYVETLWYLPVMAWLLLASAWAKKAPFLWAVLPPVALCILEEMFLDTNHILELVGSRLWLFIGRDGMEDFFEREFELFDGHMQMSGGPGFGIGIFGELFTTPGFWYGLVFAAACTAGAIWLRRYRDES